MRTGSCLALAALTLLIGCTKPEQDLELSSSSVPPPEYVTETYVDYSGSTDWSGDSGDSGTVAQADPAYASYDTGGGRQHVVQRRDTLYGLARSYYSDASQWKKIYQANQDQISDPNQIKVGMKLVIP